MQSRIHLHAKALLFSSASVGFALIATFFFYDGPLQIPRFEASASAQAATDDWNETVEAIEHGSPPNSKADQPLAGLLPSSFQSKWTTVTLDGGQMHLHMLSTPFRLSHTRNQAGSEAFDYASYLFEQMAKEMKSPELAARLQALSLQAQTLGHTVRSASSIQYSGPPGEDMTHLQVRSSILFHLNKLNPNALVNASYNQKGQLLEENVKQGTAIGEDLQALMEKATSVLQHPSAQRYSQTMQLVQQETELLKTLSSHLTLRWESTLYCGKTCNDVATYVRIYTRQTLPETTLAAVSIPAKRN
jgi:hypothetical protein